MIKQFSLSILLASTQLFAQLPTASEIAGQMTIGWNIGNSLEVPSGETGWGNPMVSQELIDSVSKAGFNTVRIPCAMDSHADQTTLIIDTNWLSRVQEVINYCYNNEMYVILNIHWDGGWLENNVTPSMQDTVNKKQEAYWIQIADYFEDYDERLLFASANEPNVSNSSQMNVLLSYHQTFVNAVRSTGGNNASRVLVIQGPSTDIDKTFQLMGSMPDDEVEDRLMAEIHYYTPWNFCGLEKDESWGKMFYYWGEDYKSINNSERNANWGLENDVNNYFQKMKTKFVDNGIPVIMGEYGVIKRSSLTGENLSLHIASREYYNKYVTKSAINHGLIPIYWDNGWSGNNGFGLFDRNNGAIVDKGLIDALIQGSSTTTSILENIKYEKKNNIEFVNASPNPVSSSTEIQYSLKKTSDSKVYIFNALGQRVAFYNELSSKKGLNRVSWNASKLPSGAYFIKIISGNHVLSKKVLVIR